MTDTAAQERLARLLGYQAQDPQNFSLLVDIAALQLSLGETARARQSAQQAIALAGDKPQGHALLGLVAAREGHYQPTVDALDTAIALGDDTPAVLYHHAYALAMLGRYVDAKQSAAAAAQFAREYPFAPALYVRVLHHLGDVESAIAYAETLRSDGISAPRINGMLSTLYMDAESFDKARAAAAEALGEDDNDIDAHTTLGLLALGDLNAEQAQSEFDRVLQANADNGRALLGSGLGRLLAGDIDAAIVALEQTTQATNMRGHLGTWQTLAWCYILQKNIDAAERTLQYALELDRNFAETHGGLAVVALMRGNIDSATQAIKRASGLDRDNFSGRFAQTLLQQISGNAAEARQLMDVLLTQAKTPDGKSVKVVIAEMMAKNAMGAQDRLH
jgi:tetratricopeptide (TPR) repeat protein